MTYAKACHQLEKNKIYSFIKNNKYVNFIIIMLPIFYSYLYIKFYGVNILYADDYRILYFIFKDKISINDFFTGDGGHLLFIPNIFFYIISILSHINILYILYFSVTLFNILYLLLIYKFNIYKKSVFFATLFAVIFLHPMNFNTLLMGNGITYCIFYFFTILTLYYFSLYINISKSFKKYFYFIISVSLAGLASFSLSSGLITWVSIFIVWLLKEKRKIFKNYLIYIWILISIICYKLYFMETTKSLNISESLSNNIFQYNINIIFYIFNFLGNFARTPVIGLLILILSLLIIFDFMKSPKSQPISCFAILLIINFLLNTVLIAISRINFGIDQAYSSRYVGYSLTIVLGIIIYIKYNYYIFLIHYKKLRNLKYKYISNLLILIIFASFFVGLHKSSTYSRVMKYSKFCLQTFESQPNDLLYKISEIKDTNFRDNIAILKLNNLNIFYNYNNINNSNYFEVIKLDTSYSKFLTIGDIQFINNENDPYLLFNGAAIDPSGQTTIDYINIIINNQVFEAYYGIKDPVVNRISKRKRFKKTGFVRAIRLALFADGTYPVGIEVINTKTHKKYIIETNINIIINNNIISINKQFNTNLTF